MADGRAEAEWAQTSAVLCLLANVHRDPKRSNAFTPDDFNPFARRPARGAPIARMNIKEAKDLLIGAFIKPGRGSGPRR